MKREVTTTIEITPGDLAEMVLRMEEDEKAKFLNSAGFLLSVDSARDIYSMNLYDISKNSNLDSYGKWMAGMLSGEGERNG